MVARRGLTLLGALIALAVAFFGAAWMWLSLEARAPQAYIIGSALLVLLASMLAARCVGHLLDTFGLGVRQAVPHDGRECPSCASPVRLGAVRCSSCLELI